MKLIHTKGTLERLEQLVAEVLNATWIDYVDRLREFRDYCNRTPVLANILAALPQVEYDFTIGMQYMQRQWPHGEAGYALRWDAINKVVESGSDRLIQSQLKAPKRLDGLATFTKLFVRPLHHYLVHQLEISSTMLYLLLRYKRSAEWFEAERLRKAYRGDGEEALDRDLRRFLFESGIDYPFSEPRSPGGRADIVAELDTDDPLVLEGKVWDSEKGYKENRVRDGLRQVMEYADKYGKDVGYVTVFNLDHKPLVFVSDPSTDEWPASIERGGRTYYFIAIEIAEQPKPVSERERGKLIEVNEVHLDKLWAESTESTG